MDEEKKSKKEESQAVVEEVEDVEETKEDIKAKNIQKIDELVKELDRIKQKGGPDIRICPKCFSLRIKIVDVLREMGISGGYPVCVCLDCGWRSNKWIYLDRKMNKEERENFLFQIAKEENGK